MQQLLLFSLQVAYSLIIIIFHPLYDWKTIIRPHGYERVYLPLYNVADTPFHIQGDVIMLDTLQRVCKQLQYN